MEEQVEARRKKLLELQEMGVEPYPNDFKPKHAIDRVEQAHGGHDALALQGLDVSYAVAGRILALRSFGKAAFIKLKDRSGTIQVYVQRDQVGPAPYEIFKRLIEVGDLVGVEGGPMRTKTGELSIMARSICLVSKSLRPLPEKWHGLKDVEIRYRRRYLDLIVNPEVAGVFVLRARLLKALRRFFDERDFLEVETPMMQSLAGGATARPFMTHHNALDLDLYLRVAPELFLKRLLVGGLERVYELNRCFRNEGISTRHNPEFTMLEFYQAYATFEDLMLLTEELLSGLARELLGDTHLSYQGQAIDLTPPFARLTVREAVARHFGLPAAELQELSCLRKLAEQVGAPLDAKLGWGKALMQVFDAVVEETLVQPTFLHDFPLEVSPLSRKKAGQPHLVDRFELYIAGREMANAFSELNDPDDQRERFQAQMDAKAQGDDEAMPYDEDYVQALEVGMPPAAGEGIGIDRLVMLFADVPSIRDVILFPLLRPEA